MTRYFVAANVWMILSVIAMLGRTYERSEPTRYSFFHGGQWFSAESYALIVFTLAAISAVFFVLT